MHMLFAQATSSSVSTSPEALQEAAAQVITQTGADQAADSAQIFADTAAAKLPEYLEWVKHVDMLFALGVFVVLMIAFYSFAKNHTAMTLFGVLAAYIIATITPLFNFLPAIGDLSDYIVKIGAFVLLAFFLSRLFFANTFFEPMNVPTGRETLLFALATAGLFIVLGLTWWPAEEISKFSQAFQFLFVKDPIRSIWIGSPAIIAIAMRGKF